MKEVGQRVASADLDVQQVAQTAGFAVCGFSPIRARLSPGDNKRSMHSPFGVPVIRCTPQVAKKKWSNHSNRRKGVMLVELCVGLTLSSGRLAKAASLIG